VEEEREVGDQVGVVKGAVGWAKEGEGKVVEEREVGGQVKGVEDQVVEGKGAVGWAKEEEGKAGEG
jgi:hypothetical protein